MECMFVHIKIQTENSKMPEGDFTCHDIMHFYMSFHALALKGGSSYTELSEWIPQNKHDEECFKWTVQWHIQGCWQG